MSLAAIRLVVAVVALVGAAEQLIVGEPWGSFWLTLIGGGLLLHRPARRYWERVAVDDPGAYALYASRMFTLFGLGSLALALTQLTGIGLRESTARGVIGLATTAYCLYWREKALRDYRRISNEKPPTE